MRLILLRSTCEVGRTCPNINVTDRDTYVVQGYPVSDYAGLAPGESVVEVPASLLPELAGHDSAHDAIRRTDRHDRGRTLVDVESLRELSLPAGEAAVEISMSLLPKLEVAHAG